jgi:hypothetical protein
MSKRLAGRSKLLFGERKLYVGMFQLLVARRKLFLDDSKLSVGKFQFMARQRRFLVREFKLLGGSFVNLSLWTAPTVLGRIEYDWNTLL